MSPLELVFPKVASCTFKNHGPSGSVQRIHALCLLSLNYLNEKVFTSLWFWFAFLAAVSALQLLCGFVWLCCPCIRSFSSFPSFVPRRQVRSLIFHLNIGQLHQLALISKNVTPDQFVFLADVLTEVLENPDRSDIRMGGECGGRLIRVCSGVKRSSPWWMAQTAKEEEEAKEREMKWPSIVYKEGTMEHSHKSSSKRC